MQQTVYLNSQPVRIVSLKDEFIYSISGAVSEPSSRLSENYSKRQLIDEYDSAVITEKKNELSQSGAA